MTTIIVQSINARTFDAHVVDVLYIYQKYIEDNLSHRYTKLINYKLTMCVLLYFFILHLPLCKMQ